MKRIPPLLALVSSFILHPASWLQAATTIDAASKYAYAANLGWVDWRGDATNGAVIGEYVCSGCLYAANTGWISLGGGAPANGIQYQNLSAGDFGVNQDGQGNLRGYAWGANIGWINFESTGAPRVDLLTGKLNGFVYSANCGWISLSNATAFVKTTSIAAGTDSDGDGLADAWERQNWGTLRPSPTLDSDGDGMTNLEEYLAGTNPRNATDYLRITSIQRGLAGDPARVDLAWTSQPTRFYAVEKRFALDTNSWSPLVELSWPGANNAAFDEAASRQFYRIRAFRPLMP